MMSTDIKSDFKIIYSTFNGHQCQQNKIMLISCVFIFLCIKDAGDESPTSLTLIWDNWTTHLVQTPAESIFVGILVTCFLQFHAMTMCLMCCSELEVSQNFEVTKLWTQVLIEHPAEVL